MPRLALLLVLLSLAACGSDAPADPAAGDDAAIAESYTVRGVYHGPRQDGAAVAVTHETIPDVMDAMRMTLRLGEDADVSELSEGTKVRCTVAFDGGRLVVRDFEPLPDTTALNLPEDLRPAVANADTTGA